MQSCRSTDYRGFQPAVRKLPRTIPRYESRSEPVLVRTLRPAVGQRPSAPGDYGRNSRPSAAPQVSGPSRNVLSSAADEGSGGFSFLHILIMGAIALVLAAGPTDTPKPKLISPAKSPPIHGKIR